MPKFWRTFEPLVPWDCLDASDCREANEGQVEMYRDCHSIGNAFVPYPHAERQLGLVVLGQFDPSMVLGMVAVRCERKGSDVLIPLSLSIPETPIAVAPTQSGPRRYLDDPDYRKGLVE